MEIACQVRVEATNCDPDTDMKYYERALFVSYYFMAANRYVLSGGGYSAQGGAKELKNQQIWLGGLFVPEAFITTTRQYVSQANSCSLEELTMEVHISDGSGKDIPRDGGTFMVTDLIESAMIPVFVVCVNHAKFPALLLT
ncbi:Cytoplasmic dynein 1 heavy chain 1 [Branchiostoma belcheri]|nr:Cytoplasmic dynein 1 heavy chain 1 [Branchiostoma belcheri]